MRRRSTRWGKNFPGCEPRLGQMPCALMGRARATDRSRGRWEEAVGFTWWRLETRQAPRLGLGHYLREDGGLRKNEKRPAGLCVHVASCRLTEGPAPEGQPSRVCLVPPKRGQRLPPGARAPFTGSRFPPEPRLFAGWRTRRCTPRSPVPETAAPGDVPALRCNRPPPVGSFQGRAWAAGGGEQRALCGLRL